MEMHYATILEALADQLAHEDALVFGAQRVSWKSLDERAARLASGMLEAGIQPGDRIGLYLYNCSEYMEAMLAALKIRAVPININYRYTATELRYLLDDSGARALVFHSSLAEPVAGATSGATGLNLQVAVPDNGEVPETAIAYEELISNCEPAARMVRRATDDFMLYTGGTTGMPKGVVYDIGTMTMALANLIAQVFDLEMAATPEQIITRALNLHREGRSFVSMPASPLMHTAGVMNAGIAMQLLGGRMVILAGRSFDAGELWATVEREKVNYMVIVGDAFSAPMLRTLQEQKEAGRAFDISSVKAIMSSGVMWSTASKRRLLELGDMKLIDGMGATEGPMAIQVSTREVPPAETARFTALPDTRLFSEDYEPIAPGSGQAGYIGIGSQLLPRGYFNDADKTSETFREIGGKRYGFTGDMGVLESDGTLLFLGRGSGCINTGGEKVYPEEVEEVVKQHAGIEHCAPQLAGYKLPRAISTVDHIQRGPNGKPDYTWAKALFPAATG